MPPSNRANTPAIRYATVAAATSHWRSDTSGLTPGLEYEVDEIRAALDFLRSPGVAAIAANSQPDPEPFQYQLPHGLPRPEGERHLHLFRPFVADQSPHLGLLFR